jgi:site-specific DNA recombinase
VLAGGARLFRLRPADAVPHEGEIVALAGQHEGEGVDRGGDGRPRIVERAADLRLIGYAEGERMTPTHATKRAKRYRYYVSASLLAGDRPQAQHGMRVPAGDIEGLALDRLRLFFSSRTEVGDALAPLDLDARMLDAALRAALSQRWLALPSIELTSVAREIVERVTVAADRIDIRMSRAKVAAALKTEGASRRPDLDSIVLSIEPSCGAPAKASASSSRMAPPLRSTLASSR